MQKKEYLIKILTQLEPVWELAEWLKVLVEEWDLSDEFMDSLMETIRTWIHSANSEIAKAKMEKWLNALEKMRQMEEESHMHDEEELAELDKLIDSF